METRYYNNALNARNRMLKGLKMMALAAVAVTGMNAITASPELQAQTIPGGEDLIGFNNANAKLAHINGRYKIVDGNHWMMDFGRNKAEASQALKVLKHYKINQLGYVGRPGPSMTYLLSNGKAPVGPMPGEDAIPFNPQTLKLAVINGRYKLVDGNHWVMDFGNKKMEAYKSLQIIKKYGFNRICFVGRPGPSLTYFRVQKSRVTRPVTVKPGIVVKPGVTKPSKPGYTRPTRPVVTQPGIVVKPGVTKPSKPNVTKPTQPSKPNVVAQPSHPNVTKPTLPSTPKRPVFNPKEDLVTFNADRTTLKLVNGRWKIVDGNHWIMDFGSNFPEALKALGVIKYYQANSRGFVGRPGPSMTYLLVDGKAPKGAMPGEDALSINPNNITVRMLNGRWKLMDGNHIVMDFATSHSEAAKTRYLIKKHGFTKICFIGRPGPSMVYFRK